MPFPKQPLFFTGGCNCQAVRYRVTVPPWSERVALPYKSPGADIGDKRLPTTLLCHCNDCRRATAQIGMHGLVVHAATMEFSTVSRLEPPHPQSTEGEDDRVWHAGDQLVEPGAPFLADGTSCLTRYRATPKRNRWFCARCGTPMAYTIDKGTLRPEIPAMVDVYLGTVDREFLEHDYFKPDHSVWTALGIPWVREQIKGGAVGVSEHPLVHLDTVMGDDFAPAVAALWKTGKDIHVSIWK